MCINIYINSLHNPPPLSLPLTLHISLFFNAHPFFSSLCILLSLYQSNLVFLYLSLSFSISDHAFISHHPSVLPSIYLKIYLSLVFLFYTCMILYISLPIYPNLSLSASTSSSISSLLFSPFIPISLFQSLLLSPPSTYLSIHFL